MKQSSTPQRDTGSKNMDIPPMRKEDATKEVNQASLHQRLSRDKVNPALSSVKIGN